MQPPWGSYWIERLKTINYRRFLEFQLEVRPTLQRLPYWTAAGLVGVLSVIYSGVFSQCISFTQVFFENRPYALFAVSPACFFLATWIVERFAPAAGGTGVPQVIHALNLNEQSHRSEIHSYLSLRVALVVAISSCLCVLGGGSLGREGPVVHIAACLFYFVGRQFTQLFPYTEHRSWIVAGAAAGVAAAFNAPLAGVVFVLEELAQQHFHQFKTVVISTAIIGGMVSQWLSGKYIYFGYPKIGDVYFSSVTWAVLVGILCGLFAYPFQLILRINWRDKFKNYLRTRLQFAVFTGICVAALANFVNSGSIGGGISEIEQLLFHDQRASWSLISSRFFGTIISHLSGCAGGFLAPSLALGAAIGSKLATVTDYANHNLLVLVGMSSFLSANFRAPFTAWVIVMEMTDRHTAIFPLMVASLVSERTVSLLLDKKPPTAPTVS